MEGTDEYYRKTAEETAEMLKVYYNDNEGWELVKKTPVSSNTAAVHSHVHTSMMFTVVITFIVVSSCVHNHC